jgi:hypothetical protein
MKKGQIILGAIALVVTAGSTLAFKVAHWGSHVHAFVLNGSSCNACLNLFTHPGGTGRATSCLTKVGNLKVLGGGSANNTFFSKSTGGSCLASSKIVDVTTVQ